MKTFLRFLFLVAALPLFAQGPNTNWQVQQFINGSYVAITIPIGPNQHGYYATVDSNGIITLTPPPSGGGSPGGSSGQVQYNNNGAFAGLTGITTVTGALSSLTLPHSTLAGAGTFIQEGKPMFSTAFSDYTGDGDGPVMGLWMLNPGPIGTPTGARGNSISIGGEGYVDDVDNSFWPLANITSLDASGSIVIGSGSLGSTTSTEDDVIIGPNNAPDLAGPFPHFYYLIGTNSAFQLASGGFDVIMMGDGVAESFPGILKRSQALGCNVLQDAGGTSSTIIDFCTGLGEDAFRNVAAGMTGCVSIGAESSLSAAGTNTTAVGYNAAGATGQTQTAGWVALGAFADYNAAASNDFIVNNMQQANRAADLADSLIAAHFSGAAGSIVNQYFKVNGAIRMQGTTVSGLATVDPSPVAGDQYYVTDATTTMTASIGITLTGGGSNVVPVFYDGAAWRGN